MLKQSVNGIRIPVSVQGDIFTVATTRKIGNNPEFSNVYRKDVSMNNGVLVSVNLKDISGGLIYAYPAAGSLANDVSFALDSSRCIVAGRVTAGGYGSQTINTLSENGSYESTFTANYSNTDQTYLLQKTDSAVEITYDPSYIGNPRNFFFNDNVTQHKTIIVKTVDLSNGIQLSPNIKLLNNYSLGRDPLTAPDTYLVAFPPVYQFSAYSADISNNIPYNIVNDASNVRFATILQADGFANVYNPYSVANIVNHVDGLNNITFTRTAAPTFTSLITAIAPQRNISVKGNRLNLVETVGSVNRTLYNGFIQDLSASSFRFNTPDVNSQLYNISLDASQNYSFSYNQNVSNLAPGATGPKIGASIETAFFATGATKLTLLPTSVTQVDLIGVKPVTDGDGKYQLEAYKYSDITSVDYMSPNIIHKLTNIGFVSSSKSTKQIRLRDASFNETPYNLADTLKTVLPTDVSGAWLTAGNYVTTTLPFNLVALSNRTGIEEIFKLVTLSPTAEHLTVGYFTLPDLFNATSNDGSPVYRVTYNGVVATPAITTSAVTLSNTFNNNVPNTADQPNGNYVTTASPNTEFVNFNVGTSTTTW